MLGVSRSCRCESVTIDVANLPNLRETVTLCKETPTNRAVGEDVLPGELFANSSISGAGLMYPLFLKVISNLQEPVQWKDGMVAEVMKGAR